jgi:hypothetical protein
MRLPKYWERFRSKRLATLALQEQLDSHRSAFYAGALAAAVELMGTRQHYRPPAERDQALDELIEEIERDRQERGEHL